MIKYYRKNMYSQTLGHFIVRVRFERIILITTYIIRCKSVFKILK